MRRDRLIALRTAALVAGGFVVLRVVYRVIFGGGSGAGLVLVDPPRVPLGGPFAGIFLFGPITTGGLASAALSALPFAGLILLAGLIGVVVDLRALLVRGSIRGPLRTVSRTLVIALSTFPALRVAVARVRIARQLRAERSPASLLVPVLEQTVERAIALGASMEVRGFAATRHPEIDRSRPVVIDDACLGYGAGDDAAWILDRVDLALAPGTLTLVTGPTGSGKTTLLDAVSGLFQHLSEGRQQGTILVGGVDRDRTPPRETAGFVGVVPQAVRWSFVASTVSEELGFALSMQDRAPDVVKRRVAEVAHQLDIAHLLNRRITALSAGEACLVAIGGALASDPGLLILDEPLADLDTAARDRVVGVLTGLAREHGVCVIVAEHTPQHWGPSPDRRIVLHAASPGAHAEAPGEAPSELAGPGTAPGTERGVTARPVLQARAVSARHGATVAVDAVDLELSSGAITALTGPNGAGKSSLLLELARPQARNTVFVDGTDVASRSLRARRRCVALVPEEFDDMLFATSVAAECARADRRAVAPGTAAAFLALIGFDGSPGSHGSRPGDVAELLGRHPRDLSAGQRLCLVIAIQLSARPRVLLIDEPTRGLDPASRALVGAALRTIAADGTAVVFATHDAEFAADYATRSIRMDRGRISEPANAMLR